MHVKKLAEFRFYETILCEDLRYAVEYASYLVKPGRAYYSRSRSTHPATGTSCASSREGPPLKHDAHGNESYSFKFAKAAGLASVLAPTTNT